MVQKVLGLVDGLPGVVGHHQCVFAVGRVDNPLIVASLSTTSSSAELAPLRTMLLSSPSSAPCRASGNWSCPGRRPRGISWMSPISSITTSWMRFTFPRRQFEDSGPLGRTTSPDGITPSVWSASKLATFS